MSGELIHREPLAHTCRPPQWFDMAPEVRYMPHPGDVWKCECGKEYRAVDAQSNHARRGMRTINAVDWLPVRKPWLRRRPMTTRLMPAMSDDRPGLQGKCIP